MRRSAGIPGQGHQGGCQHTAFVECATAGKGQALFAAHRIDLVSQDDPAWDGLRLRLLSGGGSPRPLRVRVREVLDIAGDIDGQIYMRDFKLIDQSDMIVSLIPELPGGVPGLSSGVERARGEKDAAKIREFVARVRAIEE